MLIPLIETIRIFFKNLKEVINTICLLFYYPKWLQKKDVIDVADELPEFAVANVEGS